MKKILLTILLGTSFITPCSGSMCLATINNWYYTTKSALLLYPSLWYNKIKYGTGINFNTISQGGSKVECVRDKDGVITRICDGKRVPIVLGSIPYTAEHVQKLKNDLGVSGGIVCYSLNRKFERDWSGLSKLERNQLVTIKKYPTTDYTAPSLEALRRGVQDLKNRDENPTQFLAYVHCKAGRSRSATLVTAYYLDIFHANNIEASPTEIINYLRKIRSQVGVNKSQRAALYIFQQQLKSTK